MSNRNSTDYLIHDGIRIVRLIFTALSILLAIPAIAMVIVCVNRASRSYSNKIIRAIVSSLFILKIQFPSQISCVLNSIVLQLLWDPVLPMPIPCVLRQDAPLAVPGPSALYYGMWLSVTCLGFFIYIACYVERHQAVQLPGSKWLVSERIRMLTEAILSILAIGIGFFLPFTNMIKVALAPPQETARYLELQKPPLGAFDLNIKYKSQILETDWHPISVFSPSCFDITIFTILSVLVIFAMVIGVVPVIALVYHTFAELRNNLDMSEKKRQYNITMMRVLIFQSMVPLVLVLAPLSVAVGPILLLSFHFNLMHGPLPLSICFFFVSSHSSAHSVILLTTTPTYRKKAIELFKRVTGQQFPSKLQRRSKVGTKTIDLFKPDATS
ncbi:hypothetical protein PRIPAC_80155 [Pristionchus pacificus]|uniref:G protein-coupled receptor n=1 Tax=Pristionchus pacificus TaxID=54126 RepID=A0A2A6CL66_PRIPA|nr:hypothetical protein PRIPAC_80155 [Pristionchus pacificus]|eukprot:PDM78942.1 G protein-coupled receptor [Pristionchus pacificus]